MFRKLIGDHGENLVCEYLKRQRYKILDRNFRIRGGEIDIVAKEGSTLVFVEVKTRYTRDFGPPAESMTAWKIKYLLKTARFYVQKVGWGNREYRLDFVGVDFAENSREPKIELRKNITA